MKTPLSVRMIASLFGLIALTTALCYAPTFVRGVSEWPLQILLGFAGMVATLAGTFWWISIGLWRGSRDARAAALAFCWVVFLSAPLGPLVYSHDRPMEAVWMGVAELAIFYPIYRVLTSPSIRCGFFRLPPPLTGERA